MARWRYLAQSGLRTDSDKKWKFFRGIKTPYNNVYWPSLLGVFWPRSLIFVCLWLNASVHEHVENEFGHYPAIWTTRLVNRSHISISCYWSSMPTYQVSKEHRKTNITLYLSNMMLHKTQKADFKLYLFKTFISYYFWVACSIGRLHFFFSLGHLSRWFNDGIKLCITNQNCAMRSSRQPAITKFAKRWLS